MTFGEKLVLLRKQFKFSQDELAERMNVSRQSISKWESNQNMPDTSKVVLLSKIFNVSTDQLLKDDVDILTNTSLVNDSAALSRNTNNYCTECGNKLFPNSSFCGYCGAEITPTNHKSVNTDLEDDVSIAYYKADLQLKQKALKLQEQELTEAIKQTEHQKDLIRLQLKADERSVKCPKCGSTSLSANKKGYGLGKGVVGAAVLGPYGLLAGGLGSGKIIVTCLNCGHKFKRK